VTFEHARGDATICNKKKNRKKAQCKLPTPKQYEKAIKAKGLPKEVSGAIKKRYPKSALKEIMEETEVTGKNEKLSAYEVVLETADKKEVEVRVSPNGKILEDTGAKKPEEKK